MGCNLREGKFDISASNMIIFASTFLQVQVSRQRKRIKGLQHIWVSTLIAFAQKLQINVYVDTFKGVRGLNIELYLYMQLYFAYESSIHSDGSSHMLRSALFFVV